MSAPGLDVLVRVTVYGIPDIAEAREWVGVTLSGLQLDLVTGVDSFAVLAEHPCVEVGARVLRVAEEVTPGDPLPAPVALRAPAPAARVSDREAARARWCCGWLGYVCGDVCPRPEERAERLGWEAARFAWEMEGGALTPDRMLGTCPRFGDLSDVRS